MNVESVPELDTGQDYASLCDNERWAQNSPKTVVWGMINLKMLYMHNRHDAVINRTVD